MSNSKREEEEKWLQELHDLVYATMDILPLRRIVDGLDSEVARIKHILEE